MKSIQMKSGLSAILICLLLVSSRTVAQPAGDTSPSKRHTMKQFSLLVRVPNSYTGEQAKAVHPQWDKLIAAWKASGVYIISFAFPGESYTVSGTDRTIKKESVLSDNLRVVSNIVLQAENIEKALELSKSCPILSLGGTVEVRELPNPIPVTAGSRHTN